jgi:hypothetical protein
MIEATVTSEKSVWNSYQTTRRNNQEESYLHIHNYVSANLSKAPNRLCDKSTN